MNNIPQISIIVPVYNVEEYLLECITSIVNQTFTDFELLLVDDGSLDRSGIICDELALKYEFIRVFHKRNAGVSSARNLGLEKALGKYVTFVDSDDYVKSEYLEKLYLWVEKYPQIDLVIENVDKFYSTGEVVFSSFPECELRGNEVYKILTDYADFKIGYSASKLYLLDIIKKYKLAFLPDISLAEDLFFLWDYILHANFIVICNNSNYMYRVGLETSLSNPPMGHFEKEYAIFINYLIRVQQFQAFYNLDDKLLYKALKNITVFFHRVLLSVYSNNYQRNTRLGLLLQLLNENSDWIMLYFLPDYKVDQIAKLLLLNKYFYLFDIWMSFLLKIKFKKMFGA